ncbi:MAG: helix-turn-helix domain-containing protein [Clostridium sp.]|uniref:helix-turn-helix domain-containing protein n=1 Tax=Clostridium sp. TaxID=1506 RepID=UPI00290E4062|nr:helix-turn-helix domain-containing protein [Clostridium sp.]
MEEILYTVKETSKILKTNTDYVYSLIKKGYLRCLKLGSYKIRKSTIDEFLAKYEGFDLSDLDNVKELEL